MANAFSGTITQDDISFDSNSYISNSDNWSTQYGSITYGSTIVMGSDSRCVDSKSFNNDKINYLKFQIKLDSDDHSLTTDNGHAFTGLCVANYTDDKGQSHTKRYFFYPKYVFEDDYINDYTIVQLGSNQRLNSIRIELINEEDVAVKVLETGLYVSRVIDQEAIEDEVLNNEEIYDYINDLIDTKIQAGCFIRLLASQAELSTVQEGELCRCGWIS